MNESLTPEPVKSKKSGRSIFALALAALMASFSAAGLVGVGCLACVPLFGAALGTGIIANIFDYNLTELQLCLIAVSAIFSALFLWKSGCRVAQVILVSGAYALLVANAVWFEKKAVGFLAVAVIVFAHLWRGRRSEIDCS